MPIDPVFISVFCAVRKSGGYFPIRRTLKQYIPEEIFLNDDTLKELELAVPLPVELARKLRDKGMDIPFEIIWLA